MPRMKLAVGKRRMAPRLALALRGLSGYILRACYGEGGSDCPECWKPSFATRKVARCSPACASTTARRFGSRVTMQGCCPRKTSDSCLLSMGRWASRVLIKIVGILRARSAGIQINIPPARRRDKPFMRHGKPSPLIRNQVRLAQARERRRSAWQSGLRVALRVNQGNLVENSWRTAGYRRGCVVV